MGYRLSIEDKGQGPQAVFEARHTWALPLVAWMMSIAATPIFLIGLLALVSDLQEGVDTGASLIISGIAQLFLGASIAIHLLPRLPKYITFDNTLGAVIFLELRGDKSTRRSLLPYRDIKGFSIVQTLTKGKNNKSHRRWWVVVEKKDNGHLCLVHHETREAAEAQARSLRETVKLSDAPTPEENTSAFFRLESRPESAVVSWRPHRPILSASTGLILFSGGLAAGLGYMQTNSTAGAIVSAFMGFGLFMSILGAFRSIKRPSVSIDPRGVRCNVSGALLTSQWEMDLSQVGAISFNLEANASTAGKLYVFTKDQVANIKPYRPVSDPDFSHIMSHMGQMSQVKSVSLMGLSLGQSLGLEQLLQREIRKMGGTEAA